MPRCRLMRLIACDMREGKAPGPGMVTGRTRPLWRAEIRQPRSVRTTTAEPLGSDQLVTPAPADPGMRSGGRLLKSRPPCGELRDSYRKELISIVSVRPGPTPIAEIGAPDISSSAFT
jgi:hypothetical protein